MTTEARVAGIKADDIIDAEVLIQDKMWGDANERADAMKGQLLLAALAQGLFIAKVNDAPYLKREVALEQARDAFYPKDWTGFRDYGSDIANLAVAAAYIRNEIKRRILKGEGTHRSARTVPYSGDQPNMSSSDLIGKTHIGHIAGAPSLTINEVAHGDDASHADYPRYSRDDPRSDTI